MNKKALYYFDKIVNAFELFIAFVLLIVTGIKIVEMLAELSSIELVLIHLEFEPILSIAFTLVIGLEFIRMLCKHTPETVIDVLLFAIARQLILYHEGTLPLLMGVLAIAGLFAIKKYMNVGNRE